MRTPVGRPKLGSETVSDNKRVAAALNEYFGSVLISLLINNLPGIRFSLDYISAWPNHIWG